MAIAMRPGLIRMTPETIHCHYVAEHLLNSVFQHMIPSNVFRQVEDIQRINFCEARGLSSYYQLLSEFEKKIVTLREWEVFRRRLEGSSS